MPVDAHAHLDFKEFASDLPAVIETAKNNGIRFICTCGTDLASSRTALDIAGRYPLVFAACGVHPHEADKATEASLAEFEPLLKHPKAVAVGEIGLDFHYTFSSPTAQRRVFGHFLDLAKRLQKPVMIHARGAEQEAFETVKSKGIARAMFHCFTGTPETGRAIQDAGYFVGATGIMTFNNPSNAELIQKLDPFKLITETDCPFLAPKPFRGKRNEPAHAALVFKKLTELFPGIAESQLRESILTNVRGLFGVDPTAS